MNIHEYLQFNLLIILNLQVFENIRLQTCDPVSYEETAFPDNVFQNRIVLSAVPPPDANKPCWWGDHAKALTAAVWSENFSNGWLEWLLQINNLLSFPPEHNCC